MKNNRKGFTVVELVIVIAVVAVLAAVMIPTFSGIIKKANISKQHFSKIRNNPDYKPTKPTAIALALALELDLEQTKELIGRAGYALTNSSKFDLIIQFFIQQKNYNVVEINVALYEFDQSLLGN